MHVVFDFNRTLYDPDTKELLPGASQVLQALRARGATLHLRSRKEKDREDTLDKLNIRQYFKTIEFVDQKTPEMFLSIMTEEKIRPTELWVVGDHRYSDIRNGNLADARTIWLKRGYFSTLPRAQPNDKPDIIIKEILEVLDFIS